MSRIALLTGGSTPERDVALAGAAQVVGALRSRGYDVTVVDTVTGVLSPADERALLVSAVGAEPPSAERLADLRAAELGDRIADLDAIRNADLVFLVLHGKQGEGGEVQALLERSGIAYAGTGPDGSALAMDKHRAKERFVSCGVPTPAWNLWPVDTGDVEALGWPVVVKPSKVGSTVGLTVVERREDLEEAVAEAYRFDDQVLLEQFVGGREFTVGILGRRSLAVGQIVPSHAIFDYECKYTPGMTEEIFPAPIPDALADHMRALALRAHDALGLRDFSRVDFRLGADDIPYCLEVNTLPGLTATSLLPQSAHAEGIGFPELCDEICRLGLERSRNKGPAGGM